MAEAYSMTEMRGICKKFGGVEALCDVDLQVNKREVLGLIGDNGAGKSTLIKILSGVLKPDKGSIVIEGKQVVIDSPLDARRFGISTVYQDLALCPHLTSVENIFLGQEMVRNTFRPFINILDKRAMHDESLELLKRFAITLKDMKAQTRNLSGGQQQALALARAIYNKAKLIILDEPTAALGVKESSLVLSLIRNLAEKENISIIVISHSLDHVLAISDRIMILQRGRKIADINRTETSKEEIVGILQQRLGTS